MFITGLSKSAYETHEQCPLKFFISYILKRREPTMWKATQKGTIVHKVLEILGRVKLGKASNIDKIEDKEIGTIEVNAFYTLPNDNIETLVTICYDKLAIDTDYLKWDRKVDLKDCISWVNKVLIYNDGEYNPLNTDIVELERNFEIEINQPWAMYEENQLTNTPAGFFKIRGIIDQVSKVDDHTYHILDWKTGKRTDFNTGVLKEYADFHNDIQLLMYYYAARHLYKDIKDFLVTIFFINDGGPFTVCFSEGDIQKTEELLEKKFKEIINTERPLPNRTWKCKKFCHFGRTTFENTDVVPLLEFRTRDTLARAGEVMTMCDQCDYVLSQRPLDTVVANMKTSTKS